MRLGLLMLLGSVLTLGVCDAHGHGLRDRHRRVKATSRRNDYTLQALPPEKDSDLIPSLTKDSSASSTPTPTSTTVSFAPRALNSNSTTATLPPAPSLIPSSPPAPVPTPLDLSLSHALSSQCMVYLASLLSSASFLSCLPFSLLLTTSSAYSTLVTTALQSGNYSTLNDLMAYTSSPQPSPQQCSSYMTGVMSSLISKSNCGIDLNSGVNVAKEAKLGIGNYEVMRVAESLKDETDGNGVYCYLQALKEERPDDLYLWQLPGGISLPPSSTPTCSKCSAALLNTYTSYTSTTPTLNATIIDAAARRVNDVCGPSFVNFSATSAALTRIAPLRLSYLVWGLGLVGGMWTIGLL
ncbi:hypothetical protein IAR55_001750 [Kwoniella newhampshirensis]|uniref:DUF7729 domain-containing protein n=1 Tax=Kwoniella newhampshirensis TaxID=1651941 RepID=A0AAW0Z313_9TREE